jgi:hypothetical protein
MSWLYRQGHKEVYERGPTARMIGYGLALLSALLKYYPIMGRSASLLALVKLKP